MPVLVWLAEGDDTGWPHPSYRFQKGFHRKPFSFLDDVPGVFALPFISGKFFFAVR
jgi:hypothetical protein